MTVWARAVVAHNESTAATQRASRMAVPNFMFYRVCVCACNALCRRKNPLFQKKYRNTYHNMTEGWSFATPPAWQILELARPNGWGREPLRLVDLCARNAVPILVVAHDQGRLSEVLAKLPAELVEPIREQMTPPTQMDLFGNYIKWRRDRTMLPLIGKRVFYPRRRRSLIVPIVPEEKLYGCNCDCRGPCGCLKADRGPHLSYENLSDKPLPPSGRTQWETGVIHEGELSGPFSIRHPDGSIALEGELERYRPVGLWKAVTVDGIPMSARWTESGRLSDTQPKNTLSTAAKEMERGVQWYAGIYNDDHAGTGWVNARVYGNHQPWCTRGLWSPDHETITSEEEKEANKDAPPVAEVQSPRHKRRKH